MKLFEIFDKSYGNIIWKDYKNGSWGYFDLEGKRFTVDIQFQTSSDLKDLYDVKDKYFDIADLLDDKIFVRIDYSQVVDGEYRYDNTNNASELVIKVLSTVATEASKKLNNHKFDIIYFAAKEHEDGSKNQRLTLYPKIGRSMARKIHGVCLSDNSDRSSTITLIAKNINPEEISKIREILDT